MTRAEVYCLYIFIWGIRANVYYLFRYLYGAESKTISCILSEKILTWGIKHD